MGKLSLRSSAIALLAIGMVLSPGASADLAEAATNPVANLIQFRLQNQHSWENYNADSWSNAGIVQTVTPIPSLAKNFDSLQGVVVRATLPETRGRTLESMEDGV